VSLQGMFFPIDKTIMGLSHLSSVQKPMFLMSLYCTAWLRDQDSHHGF
jgi:hypothetical protein